jgi:carbon monoxide dehydrogenase subunit G
MPLLWSQHRMKFSHEIVISRPIATILGLLGDPRHVVHWHGGLKSYTPLSGVPGEPGATARLAYEVDGKSFELLETVITNRLPQEHTATYEMKGMVNTITSRYLSESATSTRMVTVNEFKFAGMMRIVGALTGGALRAQSLRQIESFKAYAERADGDDSLST